MSEEEKKNSEVSNNIDTEKVSTEKAAETPVTKDEQKNKPAEDTSVKKTPDAVVTVTDTETNKKQDETAINSDPSTTKPEQPANTTTDATVEPSETASTGHTDATKENVAGNSKNASEQPKEASEQATATDAWNDGLTDQQKAEWDKREKEAKERYLKQCQRENQTQHHNPWKKAWIIVGLIALSMCSGAVGAAIVTRHEIRNMNRSAINYNNKNSSPRIHQYEFDYGDDDNDAGDDENDIGNQTQEKAALGVVVKETNNGVEIIDFLTGTDADSNGLKRGDIIKTIDGKSMSDFSTLRAYLDTKKVGDVVKVTVTRNGKLVGPVSVTLVSGTPTVRGFSDGFSYRN